MKSRLIIAANELSAISYCYPILRQAQNDNKKDATSISAACKHYSFIVLFFAVFTLISCKNENTEGRKLYNNHCLQCHQEEGKGVGKLIPPIDKEYLLSNTSKLGCIIKNGFSEEITIQGVKYKENMPGNDRLSDFDIVNLLNYINQKNGDGNPKKFNIENLRIDLKKCEK